MASKRERVRVTSIDPCAGRRSCSPNGAQVAHGEGWAARGDGLAMWFVGGKVLDKAAGKPLAGGLRGRRQAYPCGFGVPDPRPGRDALTARSGVANSRLTVRRRTRSRCPLRRGPPCTRVGPACRKDLRWRP
ncbi:protein of unknown function [Methylorubrum extorquens]|uniref:Uncharacterized protein n=1 Tax=Methylorubrum extorquens TaxID=408 RepID=A0A2N9AJE7_METEX|nr:hypothetical protein B2G69_04190 [Methylorubrum zatmanii]SOR27485.1 protein of unknown function [Methylorubrum extorquens]